MPLSNDRPHLLRSPTPHLLFVNDPPSEAESATVERAIATVEAGMSAGGPSSHRRREDYIQTHRAILFPLRRFPPELLEEIFQHCEEEQDDLYLNRPPWYLLHVCHLWRQVALGMSALWRHLPPMVYQPKYRRLNTSKLRFLLQYSSNAKITFLLYQNQHLVPNGVLSLLLRHSRQWERVALYVSDYVCEFLNRATVGRLPLLTTLTINFQAFKRPHALFVDAPRLRSFRCVGFMEDPISASHPSTALIPQKLTSFTSYAVLLDTHALLQVLVEPKQLEKLDVSLRAFDVPWLQIPPTTLPSLTSLTLRFPPGPQVHQSILSNLTLPCLTELVIGLFIPPRLFDDLAGMITRSMCPLHHLTIHSSARHLNWNIVGTLKLMPQLKTLDVSGLVDQHLTEKLSSWNEVEGWELVPSLESLTLHIEVPCNLPHLALARCDFIGENGVQVRQRLENFFVASSSPLDTLEDLQDIPIPASSEKLGICLRSADGLLEWESDYGPDFNKIFSKQVDDLLSIAGQLTDANEIMYLYYAKFTTSLWNFFSSVPLKLRLALNLRMRFEALFTMWANLLTESPSLIRWIWDKHGYLKYVRDSAEDRTLLFFRLKSSFLQEMAVDRNFPDNEDTRINSLYN